MQNYTTLPKGNLVNFFSEVVYDMPPTLDSVTAAESNEKCSYSVLGPTYSIIIVIISKLLVVDDLTIIG